MNDRMVPVKAGDDAPDAESTTAYDLETRPKENDITKEINRVSGKNREGTDTVKADRCRFISSSFCCVSEVIFLVQRYDDVSTVG